MSMRLLRPGGHQFIRPKPGQQDETNPAIPRPEEHGPEPPEHVTQTVVPANSLAGDVPVGRRHLGPCFGIGGKTNPARQTVIEDVPVDLEGHVQAQKPFSGELRDIVRL